MRLILFLTLTVFGWHNGVFAVSNTFMDYQNYNHGYCPDCQCIPCKCGNPDGNPHPEVNTCPKPDPCDPAPVCGTQCGLSNCTLGFLVGGIAAAAAIFVTRGFHHHS